MITLEVWGWIAAGFWTLFVLILWFSYIRYVKKSQVTIRDLESQIDDYDKLENELWVQGQESCYWRDRSAELKGEVDELKGEVDELERELGLSCLEANQWFNRATDYRSANEGLEQRLELLGGND